MNEALFFPITLCILLAATSSKAAENTIGIQVPPPDGFLALTDEITGLHSSLSKLGESTDETIDSYIAQEDYDDARAGKTPSLDRVFMIAFGPRTAENPTTIDVFERLIEGVEKSNEISAAEAERKARKSHNNALLGIVDDESPAVSEPEYYPLPPHRRTKTIFAFSAYVDRDFTLDENKQPRSGSSTYTIFFVRGFIVTLICTAPKDDLEWTREASAAWVEKILAANVPPQSEP
jgi:hypothetical protein